MKYKIGDRVVDGFDEEGTVVATDDKQDGFSKVKVRYDSFFGASGRIWKHAWIYESMLSRIIK